MIKNMSNMNKVTIKLDELVDLEWVKKEIPTEEYWNDIEKGLERWLETFNVVLKNGDSFLVGKVCFYPYRLKDCVDMDFIIRYLRKEDGSMRWKRIISAYWEYDDPLCSYDYDIQHQTF